MSGEARSVVVRLSMDTAQAIRASKEFGNEFGRAMDQAAHRSASVGRAVDDIGAKAGKMALGSALALGAMGKAAMDWESQWAGVSKTVDGTAGQLNALEDDLRELARTMPATHQEIAATAEAAGQLGVATQDVADFTEIMIQLGETTNLTSDDAATSIAQLMNVMQTVPDQVDEIGNTLVDLGNKGASTEAQILDMAQRLAGAGALVGASEAEVLAMASAMANLGIQSELGGGAMQRVFTRIYDVVQKGGGSLQGFADLAGMSADSFAQAWANDPMRAFDALLQGLGGVQANGGNVIQVLDDLGIKGTQNLQVMLRLAGAGDTLTTALDQSAAAWEQNSALTEEYGKRAETTASDVQVAWNRMKDAGIEGGNAILPVVADVAEAAGGLADTFGKLPDPVQSSVSKLLALAAIVGGTVWAGSKIYNFIQTTRESLDTLTRSSDRTSTSLGRVGRTAGGILAAGTAVGILADNIGRIDAQNLDRSLEALQRSDITGEIDTAIGSLKDLESAWNAVDLGEVVTVGGLFGDTSLDRDAQNLDLIDQKLAQLVESGNLAEASDLFSQFMAAYTGAIPGTSFDVSAIGAEAKYFDAYALALENTAASTDEAGDAARGAAGPTNELAGATDGLSGSASDASANVDRLARRLARQRDAARSAAKGFINLGDSLNDADTSLGGWLHSLEEQADALRRFRINAQQAGRRGLDEGLIKSLKAAGPEGAMRMKQLANATEAEIKRANKAWREGQAEIRRYVNMEVPPKKLRVDPSQAMSALDAVAARIAAMDGRTATTYVRTVYQHQDKLADIPMPGREQHDALGGFYPRVSAYAGGGIDRANAHQPEITRGGPVRVWSEPETKGEAYIPLANDGRRPRARAILSQTAMALGGQVSWRRGTGSGTAGSGSGGHLRITGRLHTPFGPSDIEGIATEVARAEIDAERRFDHVKAGR